VSIISRGAHDHYDRLPALAFELVRQNVAVIATAGGPVAALAAKAATTTIPIVFAAVSDPVKSGLVTSLNRPGGNITGNAGFSIELDAKRLELLVELAPAAQTLGALVNSNQPGVKAQEEEILAAAKSVGRKMIVFHTGDTQAIDSVFMTLADRKIGALLIGADALFNNHRRQIVELAARHAIVVVYPWSEFVALGGLASYAPNLWDAYRLSGLYVGRIQRCECEMARDDDDPRAPYKVYEGDECKGTYATRAEARRAQQQLAETEPVGNFIIKDILGYVVS
jgi:putative ABC transport system substrate-binding protein